MYPAQMRNEQIKMTVKIRLAVLQSEFLGDFCAKLIEGRINKDYVLEQCIAAAFFKRYHERFSFIKAGVFTLQAFEVIALKRLLMDTPMAEPVAISMRDELLGILHKEIHFM
jgi:hypothetical protein